MRAPHPHNLENSLATLKKQYLIIGFQVPEGRMQFLHLHGDFVRLLKMYDTNLSELSELPSQYDKYVKFGPIHEYQINHMANLTNAIAREIMQYMKDEDQQYGVNTEAH